VTTTPQHVPGARAAFARTVLRLIGWRTVGRLPRGGIVLGAPHTSNWDFGLGVLLLWVDGARATVLVKREMFWWPLGPFLRRLGALPTDRSGGGGLVERLVTQAQQDPDFMLALAPDGTRTKVDHWKSGFYRIATATGLPVTFAFADGPTRTLGSGPTVTMTGDVRADMDVVRAFYTDKRGLRPGRVSAVRLREEDAG
jgi:1-acyl-sn-glycerol-3-phosphate acyltransferase